MEKPKAQGLLLVDRGWLIGWFSALILALLLIGLLALLVNSYISTYKIGLGDIGAWISGRADAFTNNILSNIRLPRVLLTMVVGAALGLAGPLLQVGFRTRLADPYLLGLAGFAALGAQTFEAMGLGGFGIPLLACFGALLAVWLVGLLAADASNERRALIGISLAATALAALALLLVISAGPMGGAVINWIIGSFYGKGAPELLSIIFLAGPAIVLALFLGRVANRLQLGDDVAENLGLNAKAARTGLLSLAAVLTGLAVGVTGLLGFVGLLAAGAARGIFGNDYRFSLAGSCLLGAIFVSFADLLGRLVMPSSELPAGIFTTIIGGLYLVFLSRRAR